MKLPKIIQGGMGVGVSGWKLAQAVSKYGQLGVVSGTGINSTFIRKLQDGDPDGSIRRALKFFPIPGYADPLLEQYFLPNGRAEGKPYRLCSLPSVTPTPEQHRLITIAAFTEVFLAKEALGKKAKIAKPF